MLLSTFYLILVSALLALSGCVTCTLLSGPVVDTPLGKIRGQMQRAAEGMQVYAFTGIPFAKPPIGQLRYKRPQPMKAWGNEALDATKTPPSCMQINVFDPRHLTWLPYGQRKSEDCLYLNIWSPALNASRRFPVMAWLHGGGFGSGSAAMRLHDGRHIAALGGVVVVTIAYRLQSYGFLYDGTEEAPGNQGLHDQVLALQWIQDNVAAFGGDCTQVTLFGWSAGSVAAGFLLVSPGSKNLFKRAIMHSGPSTQPGRAQEKSAMLEHTKDFAEIFGCFNRSRNANNVPRTTVSCLRNLDASLLSPVERTFNEQGKGGFQPLFGDELLPVDPSIAAYTGDKDVVIGHVANEGSILLYSAFADTFPQVQPARKINKAEMIYYLGAQYGTLSLSDTIRLQQLYMKEIGDYEYDLLRRALVDLKGDERVICDTFENAYRLANATTVAKGGKSVYVYQMDYVSACNRRQSWFGMAHGDDVPFVFGRPFDINGGCKRDIAFSRKIVTLWSNFAKGRKLSTSDTNTWPAFTPRSMKSLYMTGRRFVVSSFRQSTRCQGLKELGL